MSVSEMALSLYRIEASGAPATCVPRMLSLPTSPTSLLDLDLHVEAFSRVGMHPALPLAEFPDNTHCSLVAGGLKLFINILKLFILFITTFSLWVFTPHSRGELPRLHLGVYYEQLGPLMGGPICRMSNLRIDYIPCHYFFSSISMSI